MAQCWLSKGHRQTYGYKNIGLPRVPGFKIGMGAYPLRLFAWQLEGALLGHQNLERHIPSYPDQGWEDSTILGGFSPKTKGLEPSLDLLRKKFIRTTKDCLRNHRWRMRNLKRGAFLNGEIYELSPGGEITSPERCARGSLPFFGRLQKGASKRGPHFRERGGGKKTFCGTTWRPPSEGKLLPPPKKGRCQSPFRRPRESFPPRGMCSS